MELAARKRDAFREQIRKKHIERLFKARREINNTVIQYTPPTHEQITNELSQQMQSLPAAVPTLVSLMDNHHSIVIPSLHSHLSQLLSTMCESNLMQWSNYIYILNSLLIWVEEGSPEKQEMIQVSVGPVLQKQFRLWQANKMMRREVIKIYFEYLLCLGVDIRVLKNVEILMVADSVKKVFVSMDEQDHLQLFEEVLSVCNNILAIPLIQPQSTNQAINYNLRIKQLKQLFISSILQNPAIIKNIIQLTLTLDQCCQIEQSLRFLINLTYVITEPAHTHNIQTGLNLLLLRFLMPKNPPLLGCKGSILLLRLANNLIVTDLHCAKNLYKEFIIDLIIGKHIRMVESRQEEDIVIMELLNTLSSFITVCCEQEDIMSYLMKEQLHKTFILGIPILRMNKEYDILERVLDGILELYNYAREGEWGEKIRAEIGECEGEIVKILEGEYSQNIGNYCDAVLKIVEEQRNKLI